MEPFICPGCSAEHLEPGEALGHRQPCADCRLDADLDLEAAAPAIHQPIAA